MQVVIIGRLQNRSWDDEQGQKRYVTEVIAEELEFVDSFKKQEPDESILYGNKTANTNSTPIENTDDSALSSDDLPF